MISAFSRLLLISLGTILWIILVLFALRQVGLRQDHEPFSHPLFDRLPWVVALGAGSDEAPAHTEAAIKNTLKVSSQIILQLDLRRTRDDQWVAYGDSRLDKFTDGQGLVSQFNLSELKSLDAGFQFQDSTGNHPFRGQGLKILTADEIFAMVPKTTALWLTVFEVEPQEILELAEALKQRELGDRLVLCSPMSRTLDELRKTNPRWLYCAGLGEVLRAQLMTSWFIEPFAPLKADIFLSDPNSDPLPDRLMHEIHRRHRKIVIHPSENPTQDLENLRLKKVDGLLTTRPTSTWRELTSSR